MLTRREWMRTAGGVVVAAAAQARVAPAMERPPAGEAKPTFCFFSKPLPELDPSELGRAVKAMGFEGVDLTVRKGGHVRPERAAEDLPRAIEAIAAHGLTVPMITTEVTSADAPGARTLLETAARSGVRYFKTGYWRYRTPDVRAHLAEASRSLEALAALARDCGIVLGFHNHEAYVGAALWDIAPAMDRTDAQWAGYYFDPRHAVAEGAGGAWKSATHLVLPRLKMIALKDFTWRQAGGEWQLENCPLGEGVVDWNWFATTLRTVPFSGPISVHLEYEIPANEAADRRDRVIEAGQRDLAFARRMIGP